MSWTLPEILSATGGELLRWGPGPFSGFSTDSRTLVGGRGIRRVARAALRRSRVPGRRGRARRVGGDHLERRTCGRGRARSRRRWPPCARRSRRGPSPPATGACRRRNGQQRQDHDQGDDRCRARRQRRLCGEEPRHRKQPRRLAADPAPTFGRRGLRGPRDGDEPSRRDLAAGRDRAPGRRRDHQRRARASREPGVAGERRRRQGGARSRSPSACHADRQRSRSAARRDW